MSAESRIASAPPDSARAVGRRRLAPAVTLALSLAACYGTLAALAALSALGVTLALNTGVWAGAIVFFAALTAIVVALGARQHGSAWPILPAVAGLALLAYVMFGRFDRLLELAGFVLLSVAVFWDYRLRRRGPPACAPSEGRPALGTGDYFFASASSSRSVAGGGVRESAAISARSSGGIASFTESSDARS